MRGRETNNDLLFSLGRHKTDKRPRSQNMSWPDFVELLEDNVTAGFGVSFAGCKSEEDYAERKSRQQYIAAVYADNRRNVNNVESRSLLYIDLDHATDKDLRQLRKTLQDRDIKYIGYTTPGDRSKFKDPDLRAVRIFVPVARPIPADQIYDVQCRFTHWLGIWDKADATAHQRSRIMYLPHQEAEFFGDPDAGRLFRVSKIASYDWEPPAESGNTEWTPATLELAEGNSAGVAEWAFEYGLELMPSGRGWAVCCPNHMNHTGNDGTDGSTAVLMPDDVHPEVRFQCQHDHCRELNRHQHLAFHMLGVPAMYSPQAHGVSRTQMRDIFGDALHADDLEEIRQTVGKEADREYVDEPCDESDLDDAPAHMFTNKIPLVDGLINFSSPWSLIGESNIGKSFLTLGLMACVSAGLPFAGQKTVKAHCFYFDAEGGESTEERKKALEMKYGVSLPWLHIINLASVAWDLTSSVGQRRMIKHVREIAGNEPVGLLAFDSLNQTVAYRDPESRPFDENSASDMGEVVKALKRLATETGGSPGVIHHPAKDSKGKRSARGSNALQGALDYCFFVDQPDPEKHGHLNFYQEKARNGRKQSPRGFLLKTVKVPGQEKDTDLISRLQSDLPAPDFTADLGEFKPKPFTTGERGETLYLIPVALEPFPDPSQRVAEKKVKSRPELALTKPQAKVLMAMEELSEEDPESDGFSKNKVCVKAGKGAGTLAAFGELTSMGLIIAADSSGMAWKLPEGINDTGDRTNGDNPATEEDLN